MIKINKKTTIVSIFSVLLAVVVLSGAVSASDIEEAQVNVENEVDESVIVLSDINMTDEGTYSDLADEIGQGGNITLERSVYTYDKGSTIKIKTPGVIDGNGALIDMANSSIQVFKIFADDVVVKNLNFINVNVNSYDCVMEFWHSGTVQNCNFSNCNGYRGNAIYIDADGLVENCNFFNNTFHGDTVYICSGTIRNCNFTGNTVYEGASASIFSGNIENCNFDNNRAERDGGAARIHDGTVKNCNFNRNYAGRDGGALSMSDGTIEDCNFTNNHADSYGGAVYASKKAYIMNSNFEMNDAFYGGAIWMAKGTVDGCSFKNNAALFYGGAVCMQEYSIIENSNFNGDIACLNGDAIFSYEDYCVEYCNFSNIDSKRAVESHYSNSGIVEECTFN